MKRLCAISVTLASLAVSLPAEIEVQNEVNEGTKMGSTKLLKKAPMEIYIGQFAIWYLTSRGDSETTNAITARSEWDLTEEDALAATDAARAYCSSSWKARDSSSKHTPPRRSKRLRLTRST